MTRNAVRKVPGAPSKRDDVGAFPASRPFEYVEIMERSIVWPGDED